MKNKTTDNNSGLIKKIDRVTEAVEKLAISTARGFEQVDKRFEQVNRRFNVLEKDLFIFKSETEKNFEEVEENFKKVRHDILDLGDKFVSRFEFDNLLVRFSRLEQKVGARVK